MQFLYIYNSNFRCFNGLKRRCHLYLVIGLELSFNLVPCTSHGTSWKPSYEPSKFANFVWDLYGIASNSRKKTCQIYFPIQNTYDHVTVSYNALCTGFLKLTKESGFRIPFRSQLLQFLTNLAQILDSESHEVGAQWPNFWSQSESVNFCFFLVNLCSKNVLHFFEISICDYSI